MPSEIEVVQSEWSGPPDEALDGAPGYSRKLAALATIKTERGEASYSFSGVMRYSVDAAKLEIIDYDIRGVRIEGLDFGVVEYRNREPLCVAIGDDRRFTIRSQVQWRDQHNPGGALELVLRGSVLENHTIAYMSSTISGSVDIDGASDLHLTTPAQW